MVNLYRIRTAAATAAAVTLMACGGSSGGGSTPAANPPIINSTNAQPAANAVLTSITQADIIANLADPIPAPTAGSTPPTAKSQSSLQSIVEEDAANCTFGGRTSLTATNETLGRLAAGNLIVDDRLEVGFEDCNLDNELSIDGNFTYTVTKNSIGDLGQGAYFIAAKFELVNLAVTDLADTSSVFVFNGNAARELDTRNPADTLSIVWSDDSVSEKAPDQTTTLTGFSITTHFEESGPNTGQYTIFGDGEIDRDDLPEPLSFVVTESNPFIGTVTFFPDGRAVQSNPTQGVLTISADDGGSIVVTPIGGDPNNAELEVDPGNGDPVEFLTVPWAELLI